MTLTVRTITAAEHRAYLAAHPRVPLRQTPAWGLTFESARTESIGWFDATTLVGTGLVRYRGLPRLPMRSVAVFESGPDIDWTGQRRPAMKLGAWTDPLVDHLRDRGAFTARINPVVAEQEWWGVDPSQPADGKDLVLHRPEPPRWEHQRAQERLRAAGWTRMSTVPPEFDAEIIVAAGITRRRIGELTRPGSALAHFRVRPGTASEIEAVQASVSQRHSGIGHPSAEELTRRWQGLTKGGAAVRVFVVEFRGDIVYGGLFAVSGDRLWDLSVALPLPDADLPEVQALRTHALSHAAMTGVRALTVPTVMRDRRAPVRPPAPGWPPVHLRRLMGSWQFPVRATWHSALAPVVDRIVL